MGQLTAKKDMTIGIGGKEEKVKAGEPIPELASAQQITSLKSQGLVAEKVEKPETKKGE